MRQKDETTIIPNGNKSIVLATIDTVGTGSPSGGLAYWPIVAWEIDNMEAGFIGARPVSFIATEDDSGDSLSGWVIFDKDSSLWASPICYEVTGYGVPSAVNAINSKFKYNDSILPDSIG